ncbi:hypothetical protein IAT38_008161 [Cryptococcus sp. DSM 104549]
MTSSEHHSHNPLASKLKNMFGPDKHAIFSATVVIHEMGNVPQLQGNFAVAWKFRGRKPRGKESLEAPPAKGHGLLSKPSMPNLKLHHPSGSTLSVRTSSTTSSLALPPTPRSLLNPESSRQRPNKASTLPIPPDCQQDTLRPEKKGSDPTPLKQVLQSSLSGKPILPMESPAMMEEPEGFDLGGDGGGGDSGGSSGSAGDAADESRVGSTAGSRESSQTRLSGQSVNSLPTGAQGRQQPPKVNTCPQVNVHRPSITSPTSAVHLRQDLSRLNLGSGAGGGGSGGTTPSMTVPVPRSTSGGRSVPRAPVRSGTTPSYATLLESLPPEERRGPAGSGGMVRTGSDATNATVGTMGTEETESSASAASGWTNAPGQDTRPGARRMRSATGPLVGGSPAIDLSSTSRKGETPIRPLRSHACKWDYELHHTLRMPIGKPGANTPTARGGRQGTGGAPVLGNGPTSESGIELTILQYPASATPAAPPSSANASIASSPMLKGGTSTPHGESSGPTATVAAMAVKAARGKDPLPEVLKPKIGEKSPIKYGTIDVDLAPFAGKGRMTRRFLLKGSRTNATVKVTVELKFMGGEENWVPPPMQEGHHVTGVVDLMGEQHDIRSDLHLVKTPSGSSSSDSNPLERTRTNMTNMTALSAASSYYPYTRNPSTASLGLVRTLTNTHHDPYEYHLRDPSPSRRDRDRERERDRERRPRPSRTHTHTGVGLTPPKHRHVSPSRSAVGLASPGSMISAGRSPTHSHLDLPRASPAAPPLLLSLQEIHHRHHHHHSHHMRIPRLGHGHSSGGGGGREKGLPTMHDLPPESIIEAIFNPYPAAQAGPFTYVPEKVGMLEGEEEVMRRVAREVSGEEWEEGSGDTGEGEGGASGTAGGTSGGTGLGLEVDGKTKEGKGLWRMRGRARAERARKETKEKERKSTGST